MLNDRYYDKYLKYKNKYLHLKKLIGGNEVKITDFCEGGKDILELTSGSSIKVEYNSIAINFDISVNIPGDKIIFNSKEKNNKGEHVLEILFKNFDNLVAKLQYIRTSETYGFANLLNIFLCIAKYFGAKKIILDDDAKFYNSLGDSYYAFLYRAFQNKHSIYINDTTNLRPKFTTSYTSDDYNKDINLLHTSTVSNWLPYINYCFSIFPFYKDDFEDLFKDHITGYYDKPMIDFLEHLRTFEYMQNGKHVVGLYSLINFLFTLMQRKPVIANFIKENESNESIIALSDLYNATNRIYSAIKELSSTTYLCNSCTKE